MKKILLIALMLSCVIGVSAQTTIKVPGQNLDVKVTRAALAGGRLIVDMLIENLGNDAKIECHNNWVTATDDEGKEYKASNIGFVGYTMHGSEAFPTRIPLRFRVEVSGISSTAAAIPLFKMGVKMREGEKEVVNGSIVISNLDIQR
ncbi:MAG: hypothetical protein SNI49_07610 [Rikenellaceae bacterium]